MLAAIDVGQLWQVVWVSLLAGVGATTVYSLIVLGSARSLQARRSGHAGAAVAYAGLAGLMFLLFAAAVVYGVQIMLSKS